MEAKHNDVCDPMPTLPLEHAPPLSTHFSHPQVVFIGRGIGTPYNKEKCVKGLPKLGKVYRRDGNPWSLELTFAY